MIADNRTSAAPRRIDHRRFDDEPWSPALEQAAQERCQRKAITSGEMTLMRCLEIITLNCMRKSDIGAFVKLSLI